MFQSIANRVGKLIGFRAYPYPYLKANWYLLSGLGITYYMLSGMAYSMLHSELYINDPRNPYCKDKLIDF